MPLIKANRNDIKHCTDFQDSQNTSSGYVIPPKKFNLEAKEIFQVKILSLSFVSLKLLDAERLII